MINYKIIVALVVLLTTSVISTGFVNSADASHNSVKVDCKDLAMALITWDELLDAADDQDIVDIEHFLADEDVSQVLLKVLVDRHLDDLLDEVEDECNNLDNDIEDFLDDHVKFNVP